MPNSFWVTRAGNFLRNGRSSVSLPFPFAFCWKKKVARNNIHSSPIISNGLVYASAGAGLHVLRVSDGQIQWQLNEAIVDESGSPTIWGNLLFIAGRNHCYAIDIDTRKVQWKHSIEKLISRCAPAVVADKVIWGATDGLLRALDVASGELIWQFQVQDWIKCAPTVFDGIIYFGTDEGGVYALNAADGTLLWERHFSGSSTNDTIAIDQGKIVACIQDAGVFALDAYTSEIIWHYKTPYGPWAAPAIKDNVVFVADWNLNALSLENGQRIWTSEDCSLHHSSPIIAGETIYIGGGHRPYIYGFDRRTGEKIWDYKTGDIVFSTPAVADEKLFVGCHDGFLYCFEKDDGNR